MPFESLRRRSSPWPLLSTHSLWTGLCCALIFYLVFLNHYSLVPYESGTLGMHKPRGGPGPPVQDIYEFSLDEEDPKVFLGASRARVVSPAADYIRSEHEQAGLFSLPRMEEDQEPMEAVVPLKKKRKRCGVCGPCMKKENCGDLQHLPKPKDRTPDLQTEKV